MAKRKIAVLFGGCSSEHGISLISATNVLRNLDRSKYDVIPVGITKKGRWLFFPGDIADIEPGLWEKCADNVPAVLSPDRGMHGLLKILDDGTVALQKLDAVFPVLHGRNGEDGTVQGLLSLSGIPYVGCNTLSSAACMDKAITHALLTGAGIANAKFEVVTKNDAEDFPALEERLAASLGYPMFIKPANAGSSIGVNMVSSPEYLGDAVHIALTHDNKLVAEQRIEGAEIECAVMGNEEPVVSIPGEIRSCNAIYDYEAKYISGSSQLLIPAPIEEAVAEQVRQMAAQAYRVMGCAGLARVDFFVDRQTGSVILNEINTIPGFTAISMYPKLFAAKGIDYAELLDRLIDYAFEEADRTPA